MDIKKQIIYWQTMAEEDLDTAGLLINNNKLLFALFCCHLCIEKMLKALYVKFNKNLAPKTHDLPYLYSKINIELTEAHI